MGTMLDCGPTARELLTRLASPVRNRYYYGKLLDVYHLELEQSYGNLKRWMLNRLTLGTGVLCGLEVSVSGDRKQVRVASGVAIDGWGREIIVPTNSPGVDVTQPTDDCGRPAGDRVTAGVVTLWVCYHECEAEPSPAFVAECPDRECENGLVRERYRLRITDERAAPPRSHVDCDAAFGGPGGYFRRRRTFCQTIDDGCDAPAESCVPIALIEVGDGVVKSVDSCVVRPVVYSNAVLLDLIICLANRVDDCCGETPPVEIKAIEKVSGDNQTGAAGELAPEPLVVRVTAGGNPVASERVTFAVASGGGSIGAPPSPLGGSFQVDTDSSGEAKLPAWQFGPATGAQTVTASIATGSPDEVLFRAKVGGAPQVTLPRINAIWPANGARVSVADPATRIWFRMPHLEITFSKQMLAVHLANPKSWLRVFALRRDEQRQEVMVTPLPVVSTGVVAAPALPVAGFCEGFAIEGLTVDTVFGQKIVVLVRAAGGNIADSDATPHLLDAEFAGTALQTLAPTPPTPGSPWEKLFELGGAQSLPLAVWDAVALTPAALPSGDGAEGGLFDSFFLPLRD